MTTKQWSSSILGVWILALFLVWQLPACTQPSTEETSAEQTPQEHSHDAHTDTVPDAKPDTAPDTKPDVVVEPTPDTAPDVTPDVAPDTAPDTVVEPTPDVTPDVTEPTSEPDTAPDTVVDTTPDTIPDTTSCRKAGEVVKTGETCCSGLSKGGFYTDSLCMPPAITAICMACGDGVCDYKKGEDRCSCPKDCRTSAPTGACYPKQAYSFTCPDGQKVPWCTCDGKSPCLPECKFVGTRSEGWYDSCDGKRHKFDFCSKCKGTPICDKIGSKSEGWYCDGKLIAWAQCAKPTGRWSCIKSPENGCSSRCKTDSDCKLSACTQLGKGCVQWGGKCGSFQLCSRTKKYVANATCDAASGQCK